MNGPQRTACRKRGTPMKRPEKTHYVITCQILVYCWTDDIWQTEHGTRNTEHRQTIIKSYVWPVPLTDNDYINLYEGEWPCNCLPNIQVHNYLHYNSFLLAIEFIQFCIKIALNNYAKWNGFFPGLILLENYFEGQCWSTYFPDLEVLVIYQSCYFSCLCQ